MFMLYLPSYKSCLHTFVCSVSTLLSGARVCRAHLCKPFCLPDLLVEAEVSLQYSHLSTLLRPRLGENLGFHHDWLKFRDPHLNQLGRKVRKKRPHSERRVGSTRALEGGAWKSCSLRQRLEPRVDSLQETRER